MEYRGTAGCSDLLDLSVLAPILISFNLTGVDRHLRSLQIWHQPRGLGGHTLSPSLAHGGYWIW